jgi:hypothetical protein
MGVRLDHAGFPEVEHVPPRSVTTDGLGDLTLAD